MKIFPFAALTIVAAACSVDSGVRARTALDPSDPAGAVTPYEAPSSTAPAPRADPSAAKGTTYVCPMHADVVRDAPGQCPKCGMTLIPQSPHVHAP